MTAISRMGYISRQLPSFTLSDGSVSDGYLQRDGVHRTTTAINRVAKNLAPKVKCAQSVVCGQVRPLPPRQTRQQQLQERRRHCATTRTAMPTTGTLRRGGLADSTSPTSATWPVLLSLLWRRTTAVMNIDSSATPVVSLAIRRSYVPITRGSAKKTLPPEL